MESKSIRKKEICFLAALCMFFSSVEMVIPKPLPFMRLGLANIPLMVALKIFDFKEYILLVMLKILVQALVSGTMFSYIFLFSFAGTFASALVMLCFYKLFSLISDKLISNIGLSTTGSFANNIMQLILCRIILFGENTKYIIPVLLIFGLITGIVLGIIVNALEDKALWVKKLRSSEVKTDVGLTRDDRLTNGSLFKQYTLLILVPAYMITVLLIPVLWIKWICVFALFVVNVIVKKRIKIFSSAITTISVTIMALFVPNGKILLTIGSFNVTLGALEAGLSRSASLLCLVMGSKLMVGKNTVLPGKIGGTVNYIFSMFDKMVGIPVEFGKKGWLGNVDKSLCRVMGE